MGRAVYQRMAAISRKAIEASIAHPIQDGIVNPLSRLTIFQLRISSTIPSSRSIRNPHHPAKPRKRFEIQARRTDPGIPRRITPRILDFIEGKTFISIARFCTILSLHESL
jgi:hypothetical protein